MCVRRQLWHLRGEGALLNVFLGDLLVVRRCMRVFELLTLFIICPTTDITAVRL